MQHRRNLSLELFYPSLCCSTSVTVVFQQIVFSNFNIVANTLDESIFNISFIGKNFLIVYRNISFANI